MRAVEGDPKLLKVTEPADLELVVVVALRAVVFDAGETLVDETGLWQRAADLAGVPRFTVMGILGGLITRGEHHSRVWELLGVEQPGADFERTSSIRTRCHASPGCARGASA